ncbi:MAG: hypothetical protein WCH11_00805 [Bdellovibrio sp.]
MKILCVKLQQEVEASSAEAFLLLSPRVFFREPSFIFIDVESTLGFLGGAPSCIKEAKDIVHRMGGGSASIGLGQTPYRAQVMASFYGGQSLLPAQEVSLFNSLPLSALLELEGIDTWKEKTQIQSCIDFFHSIGFSTIEEILKFQIHSFRERWGEVGISLWKRLHSVEKQVISPLRSLEPLYFYFHFDSPATEVWQIERALDPGLCSLFLRLEARQRWAQKIDIRLWCEYSDKIHSFALEPISASRDLKLYQDLLHLKLEKIELSNPIREMELNLLDVPDRIEQMDLFLFQEKSTQDPSMHLQSSQTEEEAWKRLLSFARQTEFEMGFLDLRPGHFPEDHFFLKTQFPSFVKEEDLIEKNENSFRIKKRLGMDWQESPRPNLILNFPRKILKDELQRIRFLSRIPVERISRPWWRWERISLELEGNQDPTNLYKEEERDYYFAFSESGQLLWIFQGRESMEFYLHGYFD